MSTMLAQINAYFQERGVTPADLPRVIITHEFLSVAFLALTWAACYQIQPSQSPVFAPINKALQESSNGFIVKSRQSFEFFLEKAERQINHEWLSQRGIDSGRVAVSLAESTVFRKLAKPVTIPAKLWLTLKFVQGLDGMGKAEGGRPRDDAKARRRDSATAAADVKKDAEPSRGRRARGADGAAVAGQGESVVGKGPRERGGWGEQRSLPRPLRRQGRLGMERRGQVREGKKGHLSPREKGRRTGAGVLSGGDAGGLPRAG